MADTQTSTPDTPNAGAVLGSMTGAMDGPLVPPPASPTGSVVTGGNARPPSDVQPDLSGHQQAHQYIQRWNAMEGSGQDPNSHAVAGFLPDTWVSLVREAYPQTEKMSKDQVLALRTNPQIHDQMVALLGQKDSKLLSSVGVDPNPTNLKLASWWGAGNAVKMVNSPPDTPMDQIVPASWLDVNPAAKGKTTGQVIALVNEKMTQPTLKEMLNVPLSAAAQMAQARVDSAYQAMTDNGTAFLKTLDDLQKAPLKGEAERDKMLAEAHAERQRLVKEYEDVIKHPPSAKPIDALEQFGSIGSVLGLLVGLASRQHLTTALTASGMAMQAANSNNKDQFDRNMKLWDQETNSALKMIDIENMDIKELLDDRKMEWDEKNQRISTLLAAQGVNSKLYSEGLDVATRAQDLVSKREDSASAIKAQQYPIQYMQFESAKQTWMANHPGETPNESELSMPFPLVHEQVVKNKTPTAAAQGQQVYDDTLKAEVADWLAKPENAGKTAADISPSDRAKMEQSALQAGKPTSARYPNAMIFQMIQKEHPGWDAEKLSNEYDRVVVRNQSIERAFGGGVTSRNVVSLNTLADHLPLMREYVDALNNGQFPRANAIINSIWTGTGHPEVTNAEVGRVILSDEVVRLMTQSGGAESDRQGMQETINLSRSPEQLNGALDALENFITGRYGPLEQQYSSGDASRKQFFEDNIMTPEARTLFKEHKEAEPASGIHPDKKSMPTVTDQSAYDKLPPGTKFLGPDSQQYTKPGQ